MVRSPPASLLDDLLTSSGKIVLMGRTWSQLNSIDENDVRTSADDALASIDEVNYLFAM